MASTLALRSYLFGRVDDELKSVAAVLADNLEGGQDRSLMQGQFAVPTEYMLALRNYSGVGMT